MISTRFSLLTGAAAFALAVPGLAFAQAAQPGEPNTDGDTYENQEDSATGNEIIVTATKREQTLQEIPVAVSVTTAETIERAQIRDVADLSTVVPSLRVTTLQSAANTNFIIRGFGNGANNAGIEPSVGVFVDGVYRSRTASQISDLPDVQRVEVLRGPQSTLFGKNASAGVISIVTREPQFSFGGQAELSYGNYNAILAKGVVTGPVSDSLAFSLAGGINKRDGYLDDLGTGNATNERNRWFVRGQALFENEGPVRARIIADYDSIDELCCGVINVRQSAATQAIFAVGGRVNNPADPYADVVYSNFDSTNEIENYGISGQVDFELGAGLTLTSISAFRKSNAVTNQDADFTSADLIGRKFDDVGIETFTQELRLAGEIGDRVGFLLGGYYFDESVEQNSEIFFGNQFRPYADLLIRGASAGALNVAALETQFGALAGNPALYTGRFFGTGQGLTEAYSLDNQAWSIFGQLDFEIVDGLTVTVGGNYTKDKKEIATNVVSTDVFAALNLPAIRTAATNAGISQTIGGLLGLPGGFATPAQIQGFAAAQPALFQTISTTVAGRTAPLLGLRSLQFLPPFLNVPNAVEDGKTNDGDFSYTARVAYDVTESINLYLSYATGFKASSFNLSRDSRPLASDIPALTAANLITPNLTTGSRFAGPEESTVYEAGIKADWGLASANLTVFQQEIDGFQSNIFTGTGFALANAGKQSTFGIEFEGMARPMDELTLNVAFTYLDAKYDEFLNSAIGDLSGRAVAGVPELSATFGAQWNQELGNGDRLIARGDLHLESPVQVVEGLPGFLSQGGQAAAVAAARPFRRQVDNLNASLTYAMMNGLEFTIWGRNLTNDRYLLSLFDSVAQAGSISSYPNQPRTYGASIRYRF
ncbi:TonB-dependent receptor [Qipengyuania sp. YIM B01966]|uniref:TonB-dependent receptor n=1 Tax=Qipengyuania sp. YIM B01966 TaxID=2778646 RepID=UPI0018F71221|nr:TonB-dependent receptor [Qipengyuania sp. YIM B01966]